MATLTESQIAKLYVAFFNRAPDAEGLAHWVKHYEAFVANPANIAAGKGPSEALADIAKFFEASPEFQAQLTNADGSAKSNLDFVAGMYEYLFGRQPDSEGHTYWASQLDGKSHANVAWLMIEAAQKSPTDRVLLENKTDVGLYWTSKNAGAPESANPSAADVMKKVNTESASVESTKMWIDGKATEAQAGGKITTLNDPDKAYGTITDTAGNDTFIIQELKSAHIAGQQTVTDSDTLDFSDYSAAVKVNLSTGYTNVSGLTFSKMESIIGTNRADELTGNTNDNDIVSGGGADIVDAGAGNDNIKFRNLNDVKSGSINGGTGLDDLIITHETELTVDATTFSKVSDLEKLIVGYRNEDTKVTGFTTLTVADPANFGSIKTVQVVGANGSEVTVKDATPGATPNEALKSLDLMDFAGPTKIIFEGDAVLPKAINAVDAKDRNGKDVDDVIQAAGNLDASGTALKNIEVLQVTVAGKTITAGKKTLEDVRDVIGFKASGSTLGGDTELSLKVAAGDVVDLTKPNFQNIDLVKQQQVSLKDVASKIIANQSLLQSFADNDAKGGANTDTGFVSGFTESTLVASGIGLDLSVLADADGANKFKALDFGTAYEVTIGAITASTALKTITGSENTDDMLRIKPDTGLLVQDMSAITVTKVERLDFEEIGVVSFKTIDDSVKQISGDNDGKYVAEPAPGAGTLIMPTTDAVPVATGTHIFNANLDTAGKSVALDLRGVKMVDIGGFAGDATERKYMVDGATDFGSKFVSLNGKADGTGLAADTKVTIVADAAGAYKLSTITKAEQATVLVAADGKTTFTANDKFIGSKGDDVVTGAQVGIYYDLGKGNDEFTGHAKANEVVLGGEGNDVIDLKDNTATAATAATINVPSIFNLIAGQSAEAADYAGFFSAPPGVNYVSPVALAALAAAPVGAYAEGGDGNDTITSGKGDDVLLGGKDGDGITGGQGNDLLIGGEGDDILSGDANGLKLDESGTDVLFGGDGNDAIQGDHGEDFIIGGKGRDGLRGGTEDGNPGARDHFIFEAGDSGKTADTADIIWDFVSDSNVDAKKAILTKQGAEQALVDAVNSDVLYFNWFASDAAMTAAGVTPAGAITTVAGDPDVGTGAIGASYGTHLRDVRNAAATKDSLEAAANEALKVAYTEASLTTLAANAYTSLAAQFEYGGKEYVVIDALVVGDAEAGVGKGVESAKYNDATGLIVQVNNEVASWSLSNEDIVVTRWDLSSGGVVIS